MVCAIRNQWRSRSLCDRTSKLSGSVAQQRVVRTEVDRATRSADRQESRFRNPDDPHDP